MTTLPRAPSTTAPAVTVEGNVVMRGERRWTVGREGDVVVTGEWGCDARPAVALLRPATGEVWSFHEWVDRPVTGRYLTTVPGGVDLRAVRTGRCVRLQVVTADGAAVWVLDA